ncbi:MAG TPA: acyl-CoA reductase, partial [Candidatus Binataceae bacterium]|nr:acyl-CoA reductase [Candidatus Binataceae bacterium]
LDIRRAAARMRGLPPVEPVSTADSLGQVLRRWRQRDFELRRVTVAAIAAAWGYSEPLLDASLDALLSPFSDEALAACVASVISNPGSAGREVSEIVGEKTRKGREKISPEIIGMVMPGNLPGAGLHEVVIGLLSGKALLLKTSAAEPFFFAGLARTIRQVDEALADHLTVFNWGREREDLNAAMRASCDWLVAYGDDHTLRHLKEGDGIGAVGEGPAVGEAERPPLKAGFGQRFSGAYVAADGFAANGDASKRTAMIEALALDVSLFEQAGCLSPQHIFVQDPQPGRSLLSGASGVGTARGNAYELAAGLAAVLERTTLPPPRRLGLETAAALRRVRESARWRMLGGASVAMWEGERLSWTVIYDEAALFTSSPGFRTVTVSAVADAGELARRLVEVSGRLEAFALAGADLREVECCLVEHGASYLCAPGAMQSPPLAWRHGGGVFLDALNGVRKS